jgi:hypothetical protein
MWLYKPGMGTGDGHDSGDRRRHAREVDVSEGVRSAAANARCSRANVRRLAGLAHGRAGSTARDRGRGATRPGPPAHELECRALAKGGLGPKASRGAVALVVVLLGLALKDAPRLSLEVAVAYPHGATSPSAISLREAKRAERAECLRTLEAQPLFDRAPGVRRRGPR